MLLKSLRISKSNHIYLREDYFVVEIIREPQAKLVFAQLLIIYHIMFDHSDFDLTRNRPFFYTGYFLSEYLANGAAGRSK